MNSGWRAIGALLCKSGGVPDVYRQWREQLEESFAAVRDFMAHCQAVNIIVERDTSDQAKVTAIEACKCPGDLALHGGADPRVQL